eukprot:TRINITY_DN1578_c0_g2_i1.p1 TRINITY_DN1578_c0_g2~~TRINITY_DN1578_c0_g2_i1.p1  ORF type:complete len:107 (-),score=7.12 TRINITY_DN1578_c0_g2_i1:385-705(-)
MALMLARKSDGMTQLQTARAAVLAVSQKLTPGSAPFCRFSQLTDTTQPDSFAESYPRRNATLVSGFYKPIPSLHNPESSSRTKVAGTMSSNTGHFQEAATPPLEGT